MHDGIIVFEEIDFIDTGNRLSSTLSQGVNQDIVVSGRGFGDSFKLHKNGTLRLATPFPPILVESPNFSANFLRASCTASIKIIYK